MPTLYQIIMVALVASFLILLSEKTEVRDKLAEYFELKKINLLSELVKCDFCLSFWTSVLITFISFIFINDMDITYLLIPIFSTPITRYIL